MTNPVFSAMLTRYEIHSNYDEENALREIMQQITLAGLYRGGFFDRAAFYGGTCLRIFYGLQRFSEDMDFSLLQPDAHFQLENYFDPIIDEFKGLGREVSITKKDKKTLTNVKSAFLKDSTDIYNLSFSSEKNLKIKIEVDTEPPPGFETEFKLLMLPFSFMARTYSVSDLFAGKMHAFLFRNWKNRVKGRDWFDFEWYVRNKVPLNFAHLQQRTMQLNAIGEFEFSSDFFIKSLQERIRNTDINKVKEDVRPFLKNASDLDIWSTDYFLQLVDWVQFK